MELELPSAIIRVDMVTPYSLSKSDSSYLKTSRAFDIPIHSRALLAAIPSRLVIDSVGITSGDSALSQPRVVAFTLPLLLSIHLKLVTVLDYS